jgi:hypothetical protein
MKTTRSTLLTAALCFAIGACGGDTKTNSSAASSGSTPAPSANPVASASAKPADSAQAKKDTPDIDAILNDSSKDTPAAGALKVDLSGIDKDAPPLGMPTAKKADDKLEWLGFGDVQIGNPGWAKTKKGELGQLLDPTKKAGLLFAPFSDQKEGEARVKDLIDLWKLKDVKFGSKQKKFVLGPDKLPALMGFAQGKEPEGTPIQIFYVFVQTGGKSNVLALAGIDDGVTKEAKDTLFGILDSIKKK